MITNDPIRDASLRDYEHEKWLETLPKCRYCQNPIQDESAVYLEDLGEYICDSCIDDMRKEIE